MRLPAEYSVVLPIQRGAKGQDVRLVQELLCLHDCSLRVDGAYGPATEATIRKFQTKSKLPSTGVVDDDTFRHLAAPVLRAAKPLATTAETYAQRVVSAARQHVREHPREIGGQNRGPWVRLYTGGKEGPEWPWCAAFVTYLLKQAAEGIRPDPQPIKGSMSCDNLMAQGMEASRFVPERLIKSGDVSLDDLMPGTIFLARNKNNPNDWIHTGIVTAFYPDYMETIEGNTNDEGVREGYEVCRRFRGYTNMDFISLAPLASDAA